MYQQRPAAGYRREFTRFVFLWVLSFISSAAIAGVVGTGTPLSCTQAALQTQINAGGTVTFNCGGGAVTIAIGSSPLGIGTASAVTINGGGLITLDGGTVNQIMVISGGTSPLPAIILQNLTFSNGFKTGGLQAGGAIENGGTVTITGSTFSGNQAPFGGAILSQRCSTVNSLPCAAASVTIQNSTFANNTATNSGGAINIQSDALNVSNTTFTTNSAPGGGAIYLFANSTYTTNATISGNTFSGNSATTARGGAINVESLRAGTATIANNTFYNNRANGGNSFATGGAIEVGAKTVLTNNTIVGNSSTAGGGIHFNVPAASATMQNTIIASNTASNCAFGSGAGFTGSNNLQFGDATCTGMPVNNPLVGVLASNGGPTQTMALTVGSPAIDAGNNATCTATDQRGNPRIDGDGSGSVVCDIGAYEFDPAAGTATVPAFILQSDCLFNWAEGTYPSFFAPANAISDRLAQYHYRSYLQTNAYLGTSFTDGHVYYLGPLSNNTIFDVGQLSAWILTAGCQ